MNTFTPATLAQRRQRGTATLVVIGLLAIVFIYIAANARTLHSLQRELNLVEHKQTLRIQPARPGVPATNVPGTNAPILPPATP